MRSRVIDKSAAPAAGRWDFPAVDHTAADAMRGAAKTGAHLLTAGQLEALERQVKEEARQRGFEEGLAAGKAEAAARIARLDALAAAFTHPFLSLEQAVENEVEHDPAVLHAAVADCLAVLAGSVRDVTLYFNPEDAALMRGQSPAGAEQRFKIASDAALGRGELRLASASSLVDGTTAARCAEILAAARLGSA
jgi:flagellar biosynthesis/type III secretory pathway protein FliH